MSSPTIKVMSPPVLVWVLSDADSEKRIGVQVGYLEGDLGRGMGMWDREGKTVHREEAFTSPLPLGQLGDSLETAEYPLECCTIIPTCYWLNAAPEGMDCPALATCPVRKPRELLQSEQKSSGRVTEAKCFNRSRECYRTWVGHQRNLLSPLRQPLNSWYEIISQTLPFDR